MGVLLEWELSPVDLELVVVDRLDDGWVEERRVDASEWVWVQ